MFADDANTLKRRPGVALERDDGAPARDEERLVRDIVKESERDREGFGTCSSVSLCVGLEICVERERKLSSQKSFLLTKKFWTGIQSNPIRCPSRWSVPRPRRGDQRKRARSSLSDQKRGLRLRFAGGNGGYVVGRERGVKARWYGRRYRAILSSKEKTATSRLKSRPVPVTKSFRTYETADGSRKFFVKLQKRRRHVSRRKKPV